jgi:ribA/ribD-fused uncharacterized protein
MQNYRKSLMDIFGCDQADPILNFGSPYDFLSNFHKCIVVYDGLYYNSSEHAYMAHKTLDEELREQIRSQPTSAKAKRVGRSVPLRSDWEEVKISIMYEVVFAKFSKNEDLKQLLLNTGNRYLEEGNYWNDTFWGVCREQGLNTLGQILMLVRNQLRRM